MFANHVLATCQRRKKLSQRRSRIVEIHRLFSTNLRSRVADSSTFIGHFRPICDVAHSSKFICHLRTFCDVADSSKFIRHFRPICDVAARLQIFNIYWSFPTNLRRRCNVAGSSKFIGHFRPVADSSKFVGEEWRKYDVIATSCAHCSHISQISTIRNFDNLWWLSWSFRVIWLYCFNSHLYLSVVLLLTTKYLFDWINAITPLWLEIARASSSLRI